MAPPDSIRVVDRIRVGEVELCYDLRGRRQDPLIVLVNGLGSSLVTWDDRFLQLLLDEGFAVLRFDNRDSGRSTVFDDAPPFDLSAATAGDRSVVSYLLDDLADDTAGLLDALDLPSAHLVGASLGGMIAQATAIRHAGQVRSLCSIMSTSGTRHLPQPSPEVAAVLLRPPPTDRAGFVEHEMGNMEILGSPLPELVDLDFRRARFERIYDHGVQPAGTGRLMMAVVASGDRTEALSRVAVPTLVVHGGADPLIDVSGGEATAAAVPGAQLLVIPGMGHELAPAVWSEVAAAVVANARRAEATAQSAKESG